MALRTLSMVRGDSRTYTVTFKRADGTPYCIKNWVVHFTLKKNWNLPDSQASLQKVVSTFSDTTSGTSGVADIVIDPSDTANLTPMEYDFDIVATTDTGDVYTVLRGKLDLEHDVTKTAGTAGTA